MPREVPDDVLHRVRNMWGGPPALPDKVKESLGRYAAFEALLHEVAHAVSLGIPIDKRAPERTGRMFDMFNSIHGVVGLAAEAHVVAIELNAIRALRLSHRLDLTEVIRDTWKGGMSGPAFPYKTFLSLIKNLKKQTRTEGEVTARHLRRILKWRTA